MSITQAAFLTDSTMKTVTLSRTPRAALVTVWGATTPTPPRSSAAQERPLAAALLQLARLKRTPAITSRETPCKTMVGATTTLLAALRRKAVEAQDCITVMAS